MALPGLFEFPEPLDKAVGAQFGVLAHLGFQLQGTPCWQGSVAIVRCGLGRKLRVPLVDGLGIMGAMRPELVEARASLLQFLDLLGRCGHALRLRPQDRIHGAGMTDERSTTSAAQRRFRLDPHLLPGLLPLRLLHCIYARHTVAGGTQAVDDAFDPVADILRHDLAHDLRDAGAESRRAAI